MDVFNLTFAQSSLAFSRLAMSGEVVCSPYFL